MKILTFITLFLGMVNFASAQSSLPSVQCYKGPFSGDVVFQESSPFSERYRKSYVSEVREGFRIIYHEYAGLSSSELVIEYNSAPTNPSSKPMSAYFYPQTLAKVTVGEQEILCSAKY